MKPSDLKLAVKCCTSSSPNWEDTCGACPLNKYESEDQDPWEHTVCIDSLLTALSEYLPEDK